MLRTTTNKNTKKFIYFKILPKNNKIHSNSFRHTDNKFESYPIKPSKNIIPKDINLQKIFAIMKKSSEELSKTYSHLINKYNLNNTSRKILINKIKDFILHNHIDSKILFKAILLLDILRIENEMKKLLISNEEIALGALILSLKFNYIENKMISMKNFIRFYDDKLYTLQHLFDIERKCLKAVNYYLNYATPMCFLEFFLINGIIYNTDLISSEDYYKIYLEVDNTLRQIMENSNSYLKYNFFYISCSIVAHCRNKFNLEKWPSSLKRIFGIEFSTFETEYNHFFVNKENFNIDENKKDNFNYNNNNKDIIINGNNNNFFLLNIQGQKAENDINNTMTNFNLYNKYSGKIFKNNKNIINIHINNYSNNNIFNTINNSICSPNKKREIAKITKNLNSLYYNNKHNNINYTNLYEYSYQNEIINENEKNNFVNNIKGSSNNKNKTKIFSDEDINKNIKDINDINNFNDNNDMKASVRYIQTEQNLVEKDDNNKKTKISKNKNDIIENEKNVIENNKDTNKTINIEIFNGSNKNMKMKNYNFSSRFKLKDHTMNNFENNNILTISNKKYEKANRLKKKENQNQNIQKTNNIFKSYNSNTTMLYYNNKKNKEDNNFKFERNKYNDLKKSSNINKKDDEKKFNNILSDKRISNKLYPYKIENNLDDKNKNKKSSKHSPQGSNLENNISKNKYESTKRIKLTKNDRKYFSNKDYNENKLNNNNLETPVKKGGKKIKYKTIDKENAKNNTAHKESNNINKTRYINLIKYKLSLSNSKK